MLDYHKSDLTDSLYLRYLKSYELTKETLDVTGAGAYNFILESYTRNLKYDLRFIDSEMKHYRVYKTKELKHLLKLEKIGFIQKSVDEELKLSLKEVKEYNRKKKKFDAENKRFIKIERKFRQWVPLATAEQKKAEEKVAQKVTEPVKWHLLEGKKEENPKIEKKTVETEKQSSLLENGGIPLEVGTQLKMEDFFNNHKESKP